MKKVGLVFVAAVLVPSLVLAWLAVRSLRDQQIVLERQQSLLYQGVADALAGQVREVISSSQVAFVESASKLLRDRRPEEAAGRFDELLRNEWPLAQVGFVVTTSGDILSPGAEGGLGARQFLADNSRFLANREAAEVYWNSGKIAVNNRADLKYNNAPFPQQQQALSPAPGPQEGNRNENYAQSRSLLPQQMGNNLISQRGGQQQADLQQGISRLAPAETEFRQLIGEDAQGALARFVDNKLNLLFWYRPPLASAGAPPALGKGGSKGPPPAPIYGAQVNLGHLMESLKPLVDQVEPALRREICVALLNDVARPVALSSAGFQTNWKHPFVATEIGEVLPHWEIGVYLLDPGRLSHSAQILRLTLGLLIAVLLSVIGIGSWLIVSELQRELTLARQKTDFVSNVSHELKTPLTSIRMFSELLLEGRVADPARQRSFLEIISAETARLTRLINNVLDFARMERGEKIYHMHRCDLAALLRETAEAYRPQLEAAGFVFDFKLAVAEAFVKGDRDALAQVIVNLLSNAEKYSGETKSVEIQLQIRSETRRMAQIDVMDRGTGVPASAAEKIFDQFYRAHDSLSSGIQGSGLGLTLARQIARAHGGDVLYEPRPGGGSTFSLRVPLAGPGMELD